MSDLELFRDYAEFATDSAITVTEAHLEDLGRDSQWGRLGRFRFRYHCGVLSHPYSVSGGADLLVLSDQVPVCGVLFAYKNWASSSGMRNQEETVTLLNSGRMTEAQTEGLEETKAALPAEKALWEAMSDETLEHSAWDDGPFGELVW